ncbi:MAG: energy transducer TonB [Caulobacteraceae bacterium]|nr:energy transducer TonB [Caulobacteraceae bacterium]
MNAAALRQRDNLAPAFVAAALLHLALLALAIFLPNRPPMLPIGSSVPITLVTSDKTTDTRQAVQAPEPSPAAPTQAPAPELAPPSFGAPPPTKAVQQKPVSPQPSQRPAPAEKPFDFNRLQNIIDKAQRASGQPSSSAARGPARPETAEQARPDAGQGVSQSDLAGLSQLLERLWNPNCDVPGGDAVKLQVKFTVGLNGNLLGRPSAGGAESSANAVVAAAALRALDAVRQVQPYQEPYYGRSITVNFNAKEACAKR